MRRILSAAAITLLAAILPLCAGTGTNLSQHVKFTFEEAQHIAQAREPGVIQAHRLEKEHGRVVYSFIIRMPNRTLRKVIVDADSGRVVADSPAKK